MTDRRRGGPTGSLRARVRREVRGHLAANPALRRARLPRAQRWLRALIGERSFGGFVALYAVLAGAAVAAEAVAAARASWLLPAWAAPVPALEGLLRDVTGQFLSAQVGVLGVVTIAVGLVTLIAQRESSATDVQIYYDDSLTHGLVASSVALLVVLCVQVFWPAQLVLGRLGLGAPTLASEVALTAVHAAWLVANLAGLAHFVAASLRFVQPGARAEIRERYTAGRVIPEELAGRLRQTLYENASGSLLPEAEGNDGPVILFGYVREFGEGEEAELEARFARPVVLRDVRTRPLGWALRRWWRRCREHERGQEGRRGWGVGRGASLVFVPHFDARLDGRMAWCRRRGGVPLDGVERWVVRRSFRFEPAREARGTLPHPSAILEELADKVVASIDRLAVTGFEAALGEMAAYHRFLIEAYAAYPEGSGSFSYAAVGGAFRSPHRDWLRQYRRLAERAAAKLADAPDFVEALAYAPIRLLPREGADPSPAVVPALLDLGPLLVDSLEAWVTRRTVVEDRGPAGSRRVALAGSDGRAYEEAVIALVGGWEAVLRSAVRLYRWRPSHPARPEERWRALATAWPFLAHHLRNTAHLLAAAVWNGDEIGAPRYQDALTRWPSTLLRLDLPAPAAARSTCLLLFPGLLRLDWPAAREALRPSLPDHAVERDEPGGVLSAILRGARDDVVLLTAAVLLLWFVRRKQAAELAPRLVPKLLGREPSDAEDGDGHALEGGEPVGFGSLFLGVVRIAVAGEHFEEHSHGAWLDALVSSLDVMTERTMVPGRVYTPSTLHGREGLRLPLLAMLLAHVPAAGDDGAARRVGKLASGEQAFPSGDGSLRALLHELRLLSEALGRERAELERAALALSESLDFEPAVERLRDVLDAAVAAVEARRRERLLARPADPAGLDRVRGAMEAAITSAPAGIPYFERFRIERRGSAPPGSVGEHRFAGLRKGHFTDPPMEPRVSGFEEGLVRGLAQHLSNDVLRSFARRPRERVPLPVGPDGEEFWRAMADRARPLGPAPALLVPREQAWTVLGLARDAERGSRGLRIERKPGKDGDHGYLATVAGVDVYAGVVRPGAAWLFSATALRVVRYGPVGKEGSVLDVAFEPGDDPAAGALVVRFAQSVEWDESPVLEFRTPSDPFEVGGSERDGTRVEQGASEGPG